MGKSNHEESAEGLSDMADSGQRPAVRRYVRARDIPALDCTAPGWKVSRKSGVVLHVRDLRSAANQQ
jgi:hypothetical protein